MSQAVSPSVDRVYGLARVTHCWNVSRATVYRHRQAPVVAKHRPGPVGPCDDATLLEHIKKAIAESRFTGEGYRKIWARLRFSGVRSSPGRVRRLMRENGLLAHDLVVTVVALTLLQRRLGGQQCPLPPFRQPRRRDVELPCQQLQWFTAQQPAHRPQLPLRREASPRWPAGGLVSASFLGALQQVRRLRRVRLHHSVHSALLRLRSV